MDRRTHLKIGWIFAIGSWITMVIITGILAFMLSPGKWPVTGNFFDGFFNQTYWPQLLVRTTLMFAIAAAYAIAVAARLKNTSVRSFITKTASKWGIGGLILGGILFFWYLKALPAEAQSLTSTVIVPQTLKIGIIASFVLLILYFAYTNRKPLAIKLIPSILAIVVLFGGIWSTERIREILRKPYIIPQYLYSNQIIGHDIPSKGVKSEIERINEKGILKISPFVPQGLRDINDKNRLQSGRVIALIECSSCHTLDEKGLRPLPEMVKRRGLREVETAEGFLHALSEFPYMPPFVGTPAEKNALATYLISFNK